MTCDVFRKNSKAEIGKPRMVYGISLNLSSRCCKYHVEYHRICVGIHCVKEYFFTNILLYMYVIPSKWAKRQAVKHAGRQVNRQVNKQVGKKVRRQEQFE